MEASTGYLAGRYGKLVPDRLTYLTTARKAASVTVPSIVPPENNSKSTRYQTPYQALGARGLNNLVNKSMLALFPPNTPCVKLEINDFDLDNISQGEATQGKIQEVFTKIEKAFLSNFETSGMRSKLYGVLRQLFVSGNCLLYINPQGKLRVFNLVHYVCSRDPIGTLLEAITKEDISPLTLPEATRVAHQIAIDPENPNPQLVHLYTGLMLQGDGTYKVYQELNGMLVKGSEGVYPADKLPWLALRFNVIDNESYGRGFVEEYLGDLTSYEGLSKALLDASVAAARIVFIKKPGSTINTKKLVEANNGDVIIGDIEDVKALQLDKYADMRSAMEKSQHLKEDLGWVFLLDSAVQRQAERVTAEEVRQVSSELNQAGNIHTILAQELQGPLANILLVSLQKLGKIPPLPPQVTPKIVTGLDAIGRGNDMMKLNNLLSSIQVLGQSVGPEVAAQTLQAREFIIRVCNSQGIETKGLIKTEDEIAMEQQAQQQAALEQQVAPQVAQQQAPQGQ